MNRIGDKLIAFVKTSLIHEIRVIRGQKKYKMLRQQFFILC